MPEAKQPELPHYCDNCGDVVTRGETILSPGGNEWCESCIEQETSHCQSCEDFHHIDDLDQNLHCASCCETGVDWDHRGFHDPKPSYEKVGSRRKYGIELETSESRDYESISHDTTWGAKTDGSTDGMEFVSPVLYGDKGFETVDKICAIAKQLKWELDYTTGMHLHMDMSEESDENLFKILIAFHLTYEMWASFVPSSRKRNRYCDPHNFTLSEIMEEEHFGQFLRKYGKKYEWLSINSYKFHKTFESRIHTGTLNPTKIKNWVRAHLTFVDQVCSMSVEEIREAFQGKTVEQQFEACSLIWDEKTTEYLCERAHGFGNVVRMQQERATVCTR